RRSQLPRSQSVCRGLRSGWGAGAADPRTCPPQLESQQRPKRLAVVAEAGAVLAEERADVGGIEQPLPAQDGRIQQFVAERDQLAPQPRSERDAEALL